MDRVVLRVPTPNESSAGLGKNVTSASLAIALIAASMHDGHTFVFVTLPTWLLPSNITIELGTYHAQVLACIIVLVFILFTSWVIHGLSSSSRPFLEAAVEVTPVGVQLVSIYGKQKARTIKSSAPKSSGVQRASLHVTTSQDKNETHTRYTNVQYKVRSFLPRHQIIDVIVMEVVWPHCVWSQLAFRVIDGNVLQHEMIQQNGDQSTRIDLMQKLLKQNQVSIVPIFPEDCRGLLTYGQCLDVQAEIEKLLW